MLTTAGCATLATMPRTPERLPEQPTEEREPVAARSPERARPLRRGAEERERLAKSAEAQRRRGEARKREEEDGERPAPARLGSRAAAEEAERTSPQVITANAAKSAVVTSAVSSALAASVVLGGAAPGGVALLPAMTAAAIRGIVGGAGTYLAGEVHNALWKSTDEQGNPLPRPGVLGTYLRGIVAPFTIPAGLIRNLTWNRKPAAPAAV